MMKTLKTNEAWFDNLLPEGLPIPSSTLLSGPGGSGKPLIGNVIAAAWLRQGGSVVFMSLQYPDHSFIFTGLEKIAHLDLNEYQDRIAFIELDASLEDMTPAEGNRFKANVVKPAVWDAAIERACAMVPGDGPGTLIFSSALNLLLFSPTYGKEILDKMIATAQVDSERSYLFATSTSAKGEEIAALEAATDNLIMTHSDKETHHLYMQIERMKGGSFIGEEVQVPFPPELLVDIKEIADHSRKRVIPQVSEL
jgi:KaiC/GvpD/RAD55 family RecA-like ATPase